MRVLVLSHMYPSPNDEVYGRFIHKQVQALVQRGIEIKVVSPVPWTPFFLGHLLERWRQYVSKPGRAVLDGVEIFYPRYWVLPRGWLLPSSGSRMFQAIRRLVAGIFTEFPFDLVHAHVAVPDGSAGSMLCRRLGVALVTTIHGQDLQWTLLAGKSHAKAVADAIDASARLVLVSEKLHRLAISHFGARREFAVVHNGIDPCEIFYPPGAANPRSGKTILSVSNLVRTKGVDVTIRAMKHLVPKFEGLRYLVIGEGPERSSLERLARDLGLSKNVFFLGRVSHAEVMRHMARSDVFALPSWREGFGVVYIEALAHAKPVVGCRGEGIMDLVEVKRLGLPVEPKDPGSLISALDFLLTHPEETRAMGERGRQVVLNEFTWEKNADEMIRLYEDVLAEV